MFHLCQFAVSTIAEKIREAGAEITIEDETVNTPPLGNSGVGRVSCCRTVVVDIV